MNQFACKVCGKPDSDKPMAFRGEDWCCDRHRKFIIGEMDLRNPESFSKAELAFVQKMLAE